MTMPDVHSLHGAFHVVASINLHAAVRFTMDLHTVADSISNAFVGVAEAADVRRATANTTLIWAYAEDRASFMLAPTSCDLTKWFSIAADEEDSILQSLPIIPELLNLTEEELL